MRWLLPLARFAVILWLLPVAARAGTLTLTEGDLVTSGAGPWLALGITLPEQDDTLPVVGASVTDDGATLLRHLHATRDLNGFSGVLYDNRDRGHSGLAAEAFPRLTHLEYAPELRAQQLDYGLAGRILLPAVVFGNSSTALTAGAIARSQTRLAMTTPEGPRTCALLYENNHLYVYPEHRDHDAADLFPANWTCTLTSQGSSGSDRAFLRAIAMTLAAFPSDTFAALRDRRLVAPTLQMILRKGVAAAAGREGYLSGAAHPVVFDGARLRPGRMVAEAANLRPGDIPPMVRLRVLEESFAPRAGLAGMDERLFDTHSAIARVWRSHEWAREMTVSAADTADPNGRPLSFDWRLLRGDPARVRIEPLDAAGTTARIRIAWHDAYAEPAPDLGRTGTRTVSRVDIGVFAFNGVHDSAPGIISVTFPTHQSRVYAPGGTGSMRLVSIDHDAIARGAGSFDPVLYWSAPWRDVAEYGPGGVLRGWRRTWRDGGTAFVPETGAPDPRYALDRSDPRTPVLRFTP